MAYHSRQPSYDQSNGAGADTAEQNSHGSELLEADSSGNALTAQALLSAKGANSYINYTDEHGCTPFLQSSLELACSYCGSSHSGLL
jgi:hypothetical protein